MDWKRAFVNKLFFILKMKEVRGSFNTLEKVLLTIKKRGGNTFFCVGKKIIIKQCSNTLLKHCFYLLSNSNRLEL